MAGKAKLVVKYAVRRGKNPPHNEYKDLRVFVVDETGKEHQLKQVMLDYKDQTVLDLVGLVPEEARL